MMQMMPSKSPKAHLDRAGQNDDAGIMCETTRPDVPTKPDTSTITRPPRSTPKPLDTRTLGTTPLALTA